LYLFVTITNQYKIFIGRKLIDWTNKPLVSRFKHYMGCILEFEAHTLRLNQSSTELEASLITEIITKKNDLKRMDSMEIYSNTKSNVESDEEKRFVVLNNWYIVYY